MVILLIATQCGGSDAPADNAAGTSSSETATVTDKTTTAPTTSAAATTADAAADAAAEEKTRKDEAAAIAQGQCPDSAIGITVAPEKPNYTVGQQPRFFTTVTNIGNVPCTRDLSDTLTPNVVTTLDGQTRVWASTDCFPGGDSKIVTLQPGKQERTQIDWSGTTSNEGCTEQRVPVSPGAFTVTAFSGGKASAPETFNIG